jgi:hypothetical protein
MNANLLRGDREDLTCGIQEGFPDEKYRVTEFLGQLLFVFVLVDAFNNRAVSSHSDMAGAL